VQLTLKEGKQELVRWSVIPLISNFEPQTPEAPELSPEEKKAIVISLLKKYHSSGKKIPKNAITSVAGNTVIVRYVKFPKLTRKELSKTIKVEAEPYIPFNIEEVYISFQPLNDILEDNKQKMGTVLVAAKKEFVNQKIEILESAGFKPAVIDLDAFALESTYELTQDQWPSEESVLVVNIGYSKTNFVIIEKGTSTIVKDSPIAGLVFKKNIMKILQTDSATAEKLKVEYGILLTQEEKDLALKQDNKEALGVSEAGTAMLKELSSEIKKIIQYYLSQGQDKKIDRIYIAGGSANIKNIDHGLSSELNLPVQKLNPFSKISGSSVIPEDYQISLTVAAGLAMRKPGDL
jgi:type IV pilus assembly protein PilM